MRYFSYAGGAFPLGQKTYIMGILNVTPDSFYEGSRFFTPAAAVKKAVQLSQEGADILDIGACSTRPGGEYVSEEEELNRLKSVLPAVRREVDAVISVDTFRPGIARFALENGANIINDVSGVFHSEMARVIRSFSAGYIAMHAGHAGAKTADVLAYPLGVINHVQLFFDEITEKLLQFGIEKEKICLDPGFGFAKTEAQNIELLRRFEMLDARGHALLCALSRKRFIGALSDAQTPEDRLPGTLAADLLAVQKGADIVRVHDVKEHVPLLRTADRLIR